MQRFYQNLQKKLNESAFFQQFSDSLLKSGSNFLFHNLNRSAKALLIAHAFEKTGKNIIFISADDKLAEDYLEDLDLLLGKECCHFLPDHEVLPYEKRSPHYMIRAQRITTLAAAVTREPSVFSISLRSFLRRITPHQTFRKNIISLQKFDEYDPDKLISDLVSIGYKNEPQVTKTGEFARRGGIIDIFSPNTFKPIRIEFFGDEIDSIRVFSVASQRSTGEQLDKYTLIPAREFSLQNIETEEYFWHKIHENGFYDGIEQDIKFLLPDLEVFVDYFEDCLIFWDEFQFFQTNYREIIEDTTRLYEKTISRSRIRKLPRTNDIFMSEKEITELLDRENHYFLTTGFQDFSRISKKFEAPFRSQSNLHGELEFLLVELKEKLKKGYRIFIQSDNKSQSKRMSELLPEVSEQIDFTIGVFQKGFDLVDSKIAVYTDHEIFSRYKRQRRKIRFSKDEAIADYDSLKPGDYIVHIDHGVGVYAGLKLISVASNEIECLTLRYAGNDAVYVPTYQLALVSKYISEEGITPTIHKLGGKRWENAKKRAQKQIELVAKDLVKLYAERKVRRGIRFENDNDWQRELELSFLYEDTPDQAQATQEIKEDMENDVPMERLLCGDVGFGKTEVAIRAAFKAIISGWQVAVLVPTTLLAEQHFLVFQERLAQYPVQIAMFSRFRSSKQIKTDLQKLEKGEIDIAIGTHRLLSKDVKYKKLGLLIIDEEHRFGVRHKDRLRQIKSNVDTLYMSATPIPRTMYMALSKLKELSLIRTSPKARLPIRTVIVPYDQDVIKDAINREIERGGQVFFVHNRVQTIASMTQDLRKLLSKVNFRFAHGQLPEKQLERITLDFAHHKFDVLVTTTIIESGLDIPNANTIIINRADIFGLAQLYQIRGRVGRSNRRAYAYLIVPPNMSELARKRLETLAEYESLGSGYQIALRDMELRGAGSLLGTKQSGVINAIGFNFYNRMLEEAIDKLQQQGTPTRWFEEDMKANNIRIDAELYIPADYISDEKQRLEIYKKLYSFEKISQFADIRDELQDRFGKIPAIMDKAIKYFKLMMLIRTSDMENVQIRKKEIKLEFKQTRLPSQKQIREFISAINLPVSFQAEKVLSVIFDLSDSGKNNVDAGLELMSYVKENLFKKS